MYDDNNNFLKHKCRLTACGYSMMPMIDFTETKSPVMSKDEMRLLLQG